MPVIHDDVHKAREGVPCQAGLHTRDTHVIQKGEEYHRLYGMAERGDRPYPIRMCMACHADMTAMCGGKIK